MTEHLRDVKVKVVVDTNKRTTDQEYDLESYASLADLIADVREALDILEADA